ncbi:hypothetical protein PF005_g17789, partial [Phytophthora fragariae]
DTPLRSFISTMTNSEGCPCYSGLHARYNYNGKI